MKKKLDLDNFVGFYELMKKVTKTKIISKYVYDHTWTVEEFICIDKFSNGEYLLEVRTKKVIDIFNSLYEEDIPKEINGVKVSYDGYLLLSEELIPTPLWDDINNNVVIPSNIKDIEKISEIVLPLLKEVEKLDHRKHKIKENNLENNLEKIINFINEK